MNDPRDEYMSAEEQARIYRERERALNEADECVPFDLTLPPDVDPVIPAETCADDEEILIEEFLDPNPVPDVDDPSDLLPEPIAVLSRAISQSCPGGQVALAGVSPNVVVAGADVRLVYLDELSGIAQPELFRLAAYIDELQGHTTTSLIAAIDLGNFTAFDLGIVTITNTSPAIATLIRGALVAAQNLADQTAEAIASAGQVCGWYNQPLWVVCQAGAPGYAMSLSDPGAVEKSYIAAGLFSSTISQADADSQAARSAALALACLVTNEEQDVVCSDVEGEVSDTLPLTWPVTWVKASVARDAALGDEVVTLDQQGAGTWGVSDWDDFETNTETITLGALNGQEFMQADQVNSGLRRRLRTRVIIPAGDPRTAAADLETANMIAYNLAVAELDCFVPNRPRIISCATETYGSAEVVMRHDGLGLPNTDAGRAVMFAELMGGGTASNRTNAGVLNYGLANESDDRRVAFESYVWPGYFDSTTEALATETAGNFGSEFLQCVWLSPAHDCECVGANAGMESVSGPGITSSKFATDDVADEGSWLNTEVSTATNSLPHGFITETEYPNKAADPSYTAALEWPDLPTICQTSLSCLFNACKTACCEPKPDDRPRQANGMPNYATWGNDFSKPASLAMHNAFLLAWNQARNTVRFDGCSDDCAIPSIPNYGGPASIVSRGPGTYGAPARFKFGGLLPWGSQWAEPTPPNPNDPTSSTLSLTGRVKSCHVGGGTQAPNPWGLFHCAEGFAEGYSPVGLGAEARATAIARLDCTHIGWPKHMVDCREPSQQAFGPPTNLNIVTEGGSTREANEQMENMLLTLMACRDTHNFQINFRGGSGGAVTFELTSPSVENAGASRCLPIGVSTMKLYEDDCETEIDFADIPVDVSSHVFIIARCCEDLGETPPEPLEKRFILSVIPDRHIDSEIRTPLARQVGQIGLPSGHLKLKELLKEDTDVWYIGSYYVGDLGLGKDNYVADRVVVQAHTGPLTVSETCCSPDYLGFTVYEAKVSGEGKLRVAPSSLAGLSTLPFPVTMNGEELDSDERPSIEKPAGGSWICIFIEVEPVAEEYTLEQLGVDPVTRYRIIWGLIEKAEIKVYADYAEIGEVVRVPTINDRTGDTTNKGNYVIPLAKMKGDQPVQLGYIGPLGLQMCQGGSLLVSSPVRMLVKVDPP